MEKSVLEYLESKINLFDFYINNKKILVIADYNYNLIWIIIDWINNEDLKEAILDKFCDLEDVFTFSSGMIRTEHYEAEYTKFRGIIKQFNF